MARVATSQETVLERIAARLIDQIAAFGTANCYVADEPDPEIDTSHKEFCQVTPGSGTFPEGEQFGGAENTPFEDASTWVTYYSRVKLDNPERASALLGDATVGLLPMKKLILKALTGHDLQNAGGDEILIGLITPLSAERPGRHGTDLPSVSVAFHTPFEWDLS